MEWTTKLNEDISYNNIKIKDLNGKQLFTLILYNNQVFANKYLINNGINNINDYANISSVSPTWIKLFNTAKPYLKHTNRTLLWKIYVGDIKIKKIKD